MIQLTTADVNADITLLTDKFSSGCRVIPSSSLLLKKSAVIPAVAILLSLISTLTVYFFDSYKATSINGYLSFLMTDGWVAILPTVIAGLLFFIMAYNNLMLYMAVPEDIRHESILLRHLRKVAQRTMTFFLALMASAALSAGSFPIFAFAIPALLFALLFAVNMIVGAEINRLGAGIVLEKISKLIKKI